MGCSDGVQPYDGAEMILMDIRDDLRSLCALLRGGAEAKPAAKAVEEPVNLVETTDVDSNEVSKAASRLAHHKVEEKEASRDGAILEEAKEKKSAAKRKPPVKKRRPTTKKKPVV